MTRMQGDKQKCVIHAQILKRENDVYICDQYVHDRSHVGKIQYGVYGTIG